MTTWRASNAVGWGAAALLTAMVIHQVADELVGRFRLPNVFGMNARPDQYGTWQFQAPHYGFRAGISIVIGLVIGTVIGLKVWRRAAAVAAAVAAAYTAISWLVLEVSVEWRMVDSSAEGGAGVGFPRYGFPSGALEWSYSALALIVVMIAPLWARFVARRKAA